MSDIGDAIAESIILAIVAAFVAGAVLVAVAVYGVPWLWHLAVSHVAVH